MNGRIYALKVTIMMMMVEATMKIIVCATHAILFAVSGWLSPTYYPTTDATAKLNPNPNSKAMLRKAIMTVIVYRLSSPIQPATTTITSYII